MLLKLVSHDKSGRSCSQVDLFDFICQRKVVRQRIFLYQKRRFAKLGNTSVSVARAYPMLKTLPDKTTSTNQLNKACKIYLSCELFLIELEALQFFNHNIAFPFLNIYCIYRFTQDITST